jgi:2-oxoglutarate dehydrogenase E1 component
MARESRENKSATVALMEAPNGERERVFDAFRLWGYLEADLDPLGFLQPVHHPDLPSEGEFAQEARAIYCGTIGAEFMHIADPERRRWIQERLEGQQEPVDQERALDLLIRAEFFELVLQQRYLGTKRFSLEGVTALIPLVDEILDGAGQRGAVELVMGMSHRGRLNVIAHVAKRAPEEVFAGFEDVDPRSVLGGGDVKYHMGATGEYVTCSGAKIHIHLVSNPSHLEAVDPVTVGRTRAKQDRAGEGGSKQFVPLLLHGDGAFAGQGVLAETLNLADIPAYSVGGTLHVIVNNLLGFTTVAQELHSSRFAAQLARRQSVLFSRERGRCWMGIRVGRMALGIARFGDVVIDMIGCRRHGHSGRRPNHHPTAALQSNREHPRLGNLWRRCGYADARPGHAKGRTRSRAKPAASLRKKPSLRQLPNYWSNYKGGRLSAVRSRNRCIRGRSELTSG